MSVTARAYELDALELNALLDCEWLYRAWTFQEIILASNPVILRGNEAIGWATLYNGLCVLLGWRADSKLGFSPPAKPLLWHDRNGYMKLPSVQAWLEVIMTWAGMGRPISWNGVPQRIMSINGLYGRQPLSLVSVLRVLRERNTGEPKDKTYATYGVLRSLGVTLSPVDYTHSLGRVYLDFFADLLAWRPTLINLLVDAGASSLPDAPSWVPDWSTLQHRTWLPPDRVYDFVDGIENVAQLPQMTISDSKMTIWGIAMGRITFSSGPVAGLHVWRHGSWQLTGDIGIGAVQPISNTVDVI